MKYLGHEDSLYIFENIKDVKGQYKLTQEQVKERIIPTKLRPKGYEMTNAIKK